MAAYPKISNLNPLDFPSLIKSFGIELESLNRSKSTLKIYLSSVRLYFRWLEDNGHPAIIDRRLVQAWMAELLGGGSAATSVAARLAGIRQFSKWLATEGEIPVDPLLRLNAPKAPVTLTPVLTDDQVRALIKACQGPSLRDRRDEAMVRFMVETGARIGEVMALKVADVDLTQGRAIIQNGKGNKARIVPFTAHTAKALDRYLRARRKHPLVSSEYLWVGARTYQPLSTAGWRMSLADRAKTAGLDHLHPHQLRHTMASRWLAAGGSEGGLMSVAGWSDRSMLDRYAAHTKGERAIEESRGLNLGEF